MNSANQHYCAKWELSAVFVQCVLLPSEWRLGNAVCSWNFHTSQQSYRTIKLVLPRKLYASLTGRRMSVLRCRSVSLVWPFCPAKCLSAPGHVLHNTAWPHFCVRGAVFPNHTMARSLLFTPPLHFPNQGTHPHFPSFLFWDLYSTCSENLLCSCSSRIPLHLSIAHSQTAEPQAHRLCSCCISPSRPGSFILTPASFSSEYTSTSVSVALAGYSSFQTGPGSPVCSPRFRPRLTHLQCLSLFCLQWFLAPSSLRTMPSSGGCGGGCEWFEGLADAGSVVGTSLACGVHLSLASCPLLIT